MYSTPEGGTLEVEHRLFPTVAAAWVVGSPLVATAGGGMVAARMAQASRL